MAVWQVTVEYVIKADTEEEAAERIKTADPEQWEIKEVLYLGG